MGCGVAYAASPSAAQNAAQLPDGAASTTTKTGDNQTRQDLQPVTNLAPVEVVGVTPLAGVGVNLNKVPANVQMFDASDISRQGSSNFISTLENQAGSININDDVVDPFQPDILYRGFVGSSVLGTPEGIAVYQNGVRINEAFGDTVNWDLVPSLAIQSFQLTGSNPVYGLNALGGSVAITMKNGFTYHGFGAELGGGSFGQHQESVQFGGNKDGYSAYIAANSFDSDGWRDFSPDHVRQLYMDLGKRWSRGSVHISFTGDRNRLFGEGTTPAQSLAVNRELDFTTPQENDNRLSFATITGDYHFTDHVMLQAEGYHRIFDQSVSNGNVTDYVPCEEDPSVMCHSADGVTPLLQANGQTIPNLANDLTNAAMGENDGELIHTVTTGGTLQLSDDQRLLGHDNNFVVGASVDRSNIDFSSFAQLGLLSPLLVVEPSPFIVYTPEDLANANGFTATPNDLHTNISSAGIYFTDTFNVTDALAVTASGRFNHITEDLHDLLGSDLTGNNHFDRFNPALGATYTFNPQVTAYAGYAEGARAPTPGEIECSNPSQPCLLPSSLSGDPPTLKQVVSRTAELGLRGNFQPGAAADGAIAWNVGLYSTRLSDPIYPEQVTDTEMFDVNIGGIRNQGLEAGLTWRTSRWDVFGSYSLVDATFTSAFAESSPNNPATNDNGVIFVQPGDRQPGVPRNQVKMGAQFFVTPKWEIGTVLNYFGSQYLLADESNQGAPMGGYTVVNLNSTYQVTRQISLFANVSNLLDRHYNTFGEYSDPTGAFAPGVPDVDTNGPGVDNRFFGPAPPIAIFGGVKVRFN